MRIAFSRRQLDIALSIAFDLQRAIGLPEPWASFRAYLDVTSRIALVRRTESHLGLDLRAARLLEVGAGLGLFTTVARKLGIDCIGVEPAANSYARLREGIDETLACNGVSEDAVLGAAAEKLPFENDRFDAVVAFQVMEHVASPPRFMAEVARVLKPGGALFMDMPNHWSFIEGHFGIVWLPLLAQSKRLSKAYVRLHGRRPEFLDELNLITPGRVRRWARRLALRTALRPPGDGPFASPTTDGRRVFLSVPEGYVWPRGVRFGRVGTRVRQLATSNWGQRLLWHAGMTDHLLLVGHKLDRAPP